MPPSHPIGLPRTLAAIVAIAAALVVSAATAPAQQIMVFGNNVPISAGDRTPSLADHTDFGPVDLSAGARDRTFTIRNPSNGVLQMGPPQRIGGAAGDFTIIPPYPLQVLGAEQSTTFTVRFNPSFIGPRSTTLRIVNTSATTPSFEFAIQGTGTVPEPEIKVLGNELEITSGDPLPRTADGTDFGAVDIDGTSASNTFTVQNVGDASLSISKVEFDGGSASSFAFVTVPSNTIPAGFESTFTVRFDPATTGLHSTTLRILNSDSNEANYFFTIQGTGTTFAPEVRLLGKGQAIAPGDTTPSPADNTKFPSTGLSAGYVAHQFTLANVGNSPLTVTSIVTVGAQASDFRVPSHPAAPIAPGQSAPFEVRFDPTAYGLRATTLRITSNDPVRPTYDVALLGAGGAFKLRRIERDGNDAIIHFTTNPDTTVTSYLYAIRSGTSLQSLSTVKSILSNGGTTEQYRHVNGFLGPRRFWSISEVVIP